MTSQTTNCTFEKCKLGQNTANNDGGAQMKVVMTIEEINDLVVGLFDDLVGLLLYLYF